MGSQRGPEGDQIPQRGPEGLGKLTEPVGDSRERCREVMGWWSRLGWSRRQEGRARLF